ncbi:META domain-containing protein [Methylonatrum kenyense]|uniref:META domain-containing protein n=1 Tax=Methylonatrum kenyense TaxID=455253 RepID=UPI0020BD7E9A|nr:META domain-containing protein [Methylonatrum kenyense]MCK8515663.1 META domain-containing protein [Methylonatrum kenyense]
MMDRYWTWIAAAIATLLLTGIAKAGEADPAVLDDDWHMVAFAVAGDEEDREMVPIFSIRVNEEGTAEGIAACNRWNAEADFFADGRVRFKDFSQTRSVCRFNDIVARTMDARYTDHLRNQDMDYKIEDDQLILEFDDGERWTFQVIEQDATEPAPN